MIFDNSSPEGVRNLHEFKLNYRLVPKGALYVSISLPVNMNTAKSYVKALCYITSYGALGELKRNVSERQLRQNVSTIRIKANIPLLLQLHIIFLIYTPQSLVYAYNFRLKHLIFKKKRKRNALVRQ